MKRLIILTVILISILVFFWLLVRYLTDEEPCNENPCEISSYSLMPRLDSSYNVVTFSSHPKNYCCDCSVYDATLVNCNVMYLDIGLREPELDISQDSIVLDFARIFWNDSLNSNVDSLYLELENSFSLDFYNESTINYGISKNDLNKKYPNHELFDFNSVPEYKVLYQSFGTQHYGYYEASIFHIGVRINNDFKNVDSLSLIVMSRYERMLKGREIDELKIEIEIDKPYCVLCLNQKHEFFFELTTKRRDASKKHFK